MYILVTPVKNEEDTISEVIERVAAQTLKPKLWVIVDDNSSDNSRKIIKEKSKNKNWIHDISSERNNKEYKGMFGYAKVVKRGIEYGKRICDTKDICFKYIGILDADILINEKYFQNLILEAKKNEKAGVIGGLRNNETTQITNEIIIGGARIYNKNLLKEIGGYPVIPSSDGSIEIKAKNRGWNLIRVTAPKAKAKLIRDSATKKGEWYGGKIRGKMLYYKGYRLPHSLLFSIKCGIDNSFLRGLAYFLGYLEQYINKEERIPDEEIRKHYSVTEYNKMKRKLKNFNW